MHVFTAHLGLLMTEFSWTGTPLNAHMYGCIYMYTYKYICVCVHMTAKCTYVCLKRYASTLTLMPRHRHGHMHIHTRHTSACYIHRCIQQDICMYTRTVYMNERFQTVGEVTCLSISSCSGHMGRQLDLWTPLPSGAGLSPVSWNAIPESPARVLCWVA